MLIVDEGVYGLGMSLLKFGYRKNGIFAITQKSR